MSLHNLKYIHLILLIGDLESAKVILEKLNPIYKSDLTLSTELKSAFFNNYASYYKKTEDYNAALELLEEAIKLDADSDIALAVDCNNKAVLLMSMGKYKEAYRVSKRALVSLEPVVN